MRFTVRRALLAAAALAALTPLAVRAQAYPDHPIRLLIPYAAGGSTDNMARVLQEPLQKALGQPVIIENKAGASGVIAAREVIRAKPDGYTLFFVNNGNLAVTPSVVKDANYDGVKDFTPIALVSSAAMVAVVPASVPANDLKGFIDYAKANPVAYASAGVGSFGQLATELFANRAGIKMTHVPYKGQAPTTTAAVAGEVQLLITTPSGAMNEFIQPEAAQAARRHLARAVAARPRNADDRLGAARLRGRELVRDHRPGRHAAPTWSPSSTPRSAPRCSSRKSSSASPPSAWSPRRRRRKSSARWWPRKSRAGRR